MSDDASDCKEAELRLLSGGVDLPPEGHPAHCVTLRLFYVATVLVLDNGKIAPITLSAFFGTFAAANQELAESRREWPRADVYWMHIVLDPTDEKQLADLRKLEDQIGIKTTAARIH
jgi:hypothetical protein